MREIKFRGKRIDNGEWVYGYYFIEERDIEDGIIWRDIPQIQQRYGDHFQYFDVDLATVGQYTGLHDKNGKEIYEGDIIVGTYKDMGTDTGLVVFKGCGFKVEIPNVGDDELVDWERYSDSIEVIGNIYDNPEMLEVS